MARGGGRGLPGMPGIPGTGKRGQQAPQRKKSKCGNPAKRAAEERAAAEKAAWPFRCRCQRVRPARGNGSGAARDDPMAGFDVEPSQGLREVPRREAADRSGSMSLPASPGSPRECRAR